MEMSGCEKRMILCSPAPSLHIHILTSIQHSFKPIFNRHLLCAMHCTQPGDRVYFYLFLSVYLALLSPSYDSRIFHLRCMRDL